MTTTSGVANFNLTRNELITATCEVIQIIGTGQTPLADDFTLMARALNMMVKAWHTLGLNIWTWQRLVLPLVPNKQSYRLGPAGGSIEALVVTAGGTGFSSAPTITFTGGGGSGATATAIILGGAVTAITVTAAGTGFTARPTVVFTGGGGTGATARADLFGIFALRPLKIVTAQSRAITGANDVQMTAIARRSYDALGRKASSGIPVNYYYDPQIDNGDLYVYPTANSATTHEIRLSVQRPLHDINLSTENADFPQEWFLALQWGLANEVSSRYGLPYSMMQHIEKQATLYREAISDFDGGQENVSIQLVPNLESQGGDTW